MSDRHTPQAPPHNDRAEATVIATVLRYPDAIAEVVGRITPDAFYTPTHRMVWAAIEALDRKGLPVDLPAVYGELQAVGYDSTRVASLLASIGDQSTPVGHLEHHVMTVARLARHRTMIQTAGELAELGRAGDMDTDAYIAHAEERVLSVGRNVGGLDKVDTLAPTVREYLDDLHAILDGKKDEPGLSTGLRDLDGLLGELMSGNVTIVGGRPGMGKTALAMQLALNVAAQGKGVLFFSLEMTKARLTARAISNLARVDTNRVIRGQIRTKLRKDEAGLTEIHRVVTQAKRIMRLPLYVDDRRRRTIYEIYSAARRVAHRQRIDLIVIDYLGLIVGADRRQSREQQLTEIAQTLPDMAKSLDAHVLCLAQVNRECEKRPKNKRPLMSDLRGSGGIEQAADAVVLCYRDEYYDAESEDAGIMEAIVGKNRDGRPGTARLGFEARCTRVHNLLGGQP